MHSKVFSEHPSGYELLSDSGTISPVTAGHYWRVTCSDCLTVKYNVYGLRRGQQRFHKRVAIILAMLLQLKYQCSTVTGRLTIAPLISETIVVAPCNYSLAKPFNRRCTFVSAPAIYFTMYEMKLNILQQLKASDRRIFSLISLYCVPPLTCGCTCICCNVPLHPSDLVSPWFPGSPGTTTSDTITIKLYLLAIDFVQGRTSIK